MSTGTEALSVPESIIASCSYVMERARDVMLIEAALPALANAVEQRLLAGIDDIETAFGTAGSLERDVNMIFFETAVNFYFWADTPEQKWVIEVNGAQLGGWYSLAACFDRATARAVPVYDAQFMATLNIATARELFAGAPGSAEIPLLERRVQNLNEAGKYLLERHDGEAMNLLASVGFSAPRLAETVALEISSFRDGAMYDDEWIWVLKRAQILGGDLSQLTARYAGFIIRDCEQLSAFADYRLPQVFRHFGVFEYSENLKKRIDNYVHIESASPEEVEIRAATIVGCEQLKAYLPNRSSADIDLGLWLISQDLRTNPDFKPHHRTSGWFY